MAGTEFRFWIHGVSVIPEFTKEYTGADNGLVMQRTAFGTSIKQRKGTSNWFHLAIPSATRLDEEYVEIWDANLLFDINTGAVITDIAVTQIDQNCDYKKILERKNLTITGVKNHYKMDIPNQTCYGPIVISVKVYFEAEDGQIWFNGAGARFQKR